jgi:hypothetical protein
MTDLRATTSDRPTLMPHDTPLLMAPAWVGCLHWAASEPSIIKAWQADTGCNWRPGRTPIDRMIDEATGADYAVFKSFVEWVNKNIWGSIDEGAP